MKKCTTITVFEHESLRLGNGEKGLSIEQLHALQSFHGESGTPYYSLIHNGVKFGSYVGVIQIGDLLIEVLPKADKNGDQELWRNILLSMLKTVGTFDIHAPSSSLLRVKPNSILHLYFDLFMNEVESLLQRGIIKKYHIVEENISSLKGSLCFNKHVIKNSIHKERFYVRHAIYNIDHTVHRILCKTLRLIKKINTDGTLIGKINSLLMHFPDLPDVKVDEKMFKKIVWNRKNTHYKHALKISELLLLNYHPNTVKGQTHVLALMFDMNTLWEKFVYSSLRKKLSLLKPNWTIKSQNTTDFWLPVTGSKTSLRADLVITDQVNKKKFVIDTKWKNLGTANPSVEDLRQLYVYHDYYSAEHVALLYPGEATAQKTGQYSNTETSKNSKKCGVITLAVLDNNIGRLQNDLFETLFTWTQSKT